MIRVAGIVPNSIADDLGISPGAAVLRVNGVPIRDSLDLVYHQSAEALTVEIEDGDGTPLLFEIEKEPDEPLGIQPEPDKIRRCTNACPFCFVKGNPKTDKLRASLYIKDDDYRLSFLYGHYVTLTNLSEEDWRRIEEQRLSPLFVSVHATDPDARKRMLVNPRSALINEHLDRLDRAGIRCHAQVVLCPGWNDGAVLERTIRDLYDRGDAVRSLSVVPVGLTGFNADRGIRPLTADESLETIALIETARRRAHEERGRGWCYAADELFIQAGDEPPGPAYFDDEDLVNNGVGAISTLESEVRAAVPGLPRMDGRRIVLVTGMSAARSIGALGDLIETATGARIETTARANTLYGPMVTTAGLLSGQDHLAALRPFHDFDLALFSRSALNDRNVFIDDLSLEELRGSLPDLTIWPSSRITDALST